MALQIADAALLAKVDRLAHAMGMTKTAVIELAIDRWTEEAADSGGMAGILAQLDCISDRTDACDPLEWDEHGLPLKAQSPLTQTKVDRANQD